MLFLIILQLCQSFTINSNETKIYNYGNVTKQILGQFPLPQNITIIDVGIQYQSLSSQQTLYILTLSNKKQQYGVYTINYNRLQNQNFTFQYQQSINSSLLCNQIIVINNVFVVSCTKYFYLQNGTKFIYSNELEISINKIQSFQGGMIAFSNEQNTIQYYNENFQLIGFERMDLINLFTFLDYFYILDSQFIYVIDSEELQQIPHYCKQKPTQMAVFQQLIYVYCGTLQRIDKFGQISNLNFIAKQLKFTNNFLILDKIIMDIITNKQLYQSTNDLFPSFDDSFVTQENNSLIIFKLEQNTLISAHDKNTSVVITPNQKFQVVEFGLVSKYKQQLMFNLENDEYFIQDFISGSNVSILNSFFKKAPLQMAVNFSIIAAFNYRNSSIIMLHYENQAIQALLCDFVNSNSIKLFCQKSETIAKNIDKIKSIKGIYDFITDQIVIVVKTNDSVLIFLNGVNYQLSGYEFQLVKQLLIIYSSKQLQIYRLSKNSYLREMTIELKDRITCISSNGDMIFYIDSINVLRVIKNTLQGWFIDEITQLDYQISHCYFKNNQFFIISQEFVEIRQFQTVRGRYYIDISNASQYLESDNFFYIIKDNRAYQFSVSLENSVSSINQQIIDVNESIIPYSLDSYEIIINSYQNENSTISLYDQWNKITLSQMQLPQTQEYFFKKQKQNLTFSNGHQSLTIEGIFVNRLLQQKINHNQEFHINFNSNSIDLTISNLINGPISNIEILEPQFYLQQKIEKYQFENVMLSELKIIDLVQVNQNQTLIFSQEQISICDFQQCQPLKTIDDLTCDYFEEDSYHFFLICEKQIFIIDRLKLSTIETVNISIDNSIVKFWNNFMVLWDKESQKLTLYENFIKQSENKTHPLTDFLIEDNNIIILQNNMLQYFDFNFTLITQFDLYQLLQNSTVLFNTTIFNKILAIDHQQYIISTNNAVIYKIQIKQNEFSLQNIFVNVPYLENIFTSFLTISSINNLNVSKILYAIYKKPTQELITVFFDLKDELIVPYFQAINLKFKLTKNQYLRQLQGSKFAIRNLENKTELQFYTYNDNVIIKSNYTQNNQVTVILHNFQYENISQTINFNKLIEIQNEQDEIIMNLILISFGILVLFLFIIIFYRYLRRWKITRQLNLIDEIKQK